MAWGLRQICFWRIKFFLASKIQTKILPGSFRCKNPPGRRLLQVFDHTCGTPSCRPKASSEEHLSYKLACTTAGTGKHLPHIVTKGGDESLIVEEFAIGTPITIFCQSQLWIEPVTKMRQIFKKTMAKFSESVSLPPLSILRCFFWGGHS